MNIGEEPLPARILLGGPTASGKSALALEFAEQFNGEIISVDSMQVYRGMDIGTAKPTREEQARVRHHLLDVADIRDGFNTARFLQLAGDAEAGIRGRARLPIYCGGTGLYFKALLHGLNDSPPADAKLRAELAERPLAELLEELRAKDPEHFAVIDQNNRRRVERAIEIIRLTGCPFSSRRTKWTASANQAGEIVFVLEREATELRQRIEARVDTMITAGLIEETRELLEQGLRNNQTAMQALGYRQVVEHLDGMRSLAETTALIKTRTWQFARRQMTWFRHQVPVRWISANASARAQADRFIAALRHA